MLTLLLSLIDPAAACSCVTPHLDRDVLPAHGDTGFPTDGKIRVFFESAWSPDALDGIAGEYRLRGPDGALVPLAASMVEQRLDLTPAPEGGLLPDSSYTLEQIVWYQDGRRLSDDQRWLSWRNPPADPQPRWYPVARFETGAGPQTAPPAAPAAALGASVRYAWGGGDCGPGVSVFLELDVSGAGPWDTLEFERAGQGLVAARDLVGSASEGGHRYWLGDTNCVWPKVHLDPLGDFDLSIYAVGPDGTRSAPLAVEAEPSSMIPGPIQGGLAGLQSVFLQRETPIHDPSGPPPDGAIDGPAAAGSDARCANGLEIGPEIPLLEGEVSASYESRIALGPVVDGQARAAFYEKASETLWWVRFDRGGGVERVQLPGQAYDPVVAFDAEGGGVLAGTEYSDKGSEIALISVSPGGEVRWRVIAPSSDGWHPRVAISGDRVAVAWDVAGSYPSSWSLAIFDRASGALLHGPIGLPDADELALAGADEGFVAALAGRDDVRLRAIALDGRLGAVHTPQIGGAEALDLTPTHDGWLLLRDWRGSMTLHRLDEAGQPIGPPQPFGLEGGERKPRAAWTPQGIGLSWEVYPERAARFAHLDADGALSPIARVDARSATAAMVPDGDDFVGIWLAETGYRAAPVAAWLTCRDAPAFGPPDQLPD